ncbi:MAG TPA: DUF6463 family protein [Hydrogenophaga sp.]|nr:DUF6463 family protein [Hydrogenophaga sp.]
MWTYKRAGWMLLAIGILHCGIGIVLSWDILTAWNEAGWWHSIEGAETLRMDRFAALWFQVAGLSWIALGWLMQQWLQRFGSLPPLLGWALLAIGALVAYVLPISGAWLFLPLGLRIAMPPSTVLPA